MMASDRPIVETSTRRSHVRVSRVSEAIADSSQTNHPHEDSEFLSWSYRPAYISMTDTIPAPGLPVDLLPVCQTHCNLNRVPARKLRAGSGNYSVNYRTARISMQRVQRPNSSQFRRSRRRLARETLLIDTCHTPTPSTTPQIDVAALNR